MKLEKKNKDLIQNDCGRRDFVIVHGRFSGHGLAPANGIAVDILRIKGDVMAEHWGVLQDEASQSSSKSGLPMFGDEFSR